MESDGPPPRPGPSAPGPSAPGPSTPGAPEPEGGLLPELFGPGMIDRLPAAVYVACPGEEGRWLYASPQIADLLGFAADELLADPALWASRLHPEDRSRVLGEEVGRQRLNRRVCTEYRMYDRAGRVVWLLDDATLVPHDEHGMVWHGLLYDITGRKRAEMLLAEHADVVGRVARGEGLVEVLTELARSTEAISATGRCLIAVEPGAVQAGPLLVTAAGPDRTDPAPVADPAQAADPAETADPAPVADPAAANGGSRLRVELTGTAGRPLGHLQLDYPDGGPAPEQDAELARWAAGLAVMAVQRSAEHERMATSLSLLEATLESTADGILVVDSAGRIVGHNQKFAQMWRIDPKLLASGDDEAVIASVLEQLVDPGGFIAQVQRLYASPEECSVDELRFRDGRVFERYSQPQRIDGRSVGRVWSFRDMTGPRRLEEELRALAFADPLTALANRALFLRRLTAALQQQPPAPGPAAPPAAGSTAVLLLDIDDFKNVNDSLGHVAGDRLLVEVAGRLRATLREHDLAARLGGDEFVVLLEDLAGEQDAVATGQRLLDAVARPVMLDGQQVGVRASVGVALAGEGGHADARAGEVLRNADLAMYTAKRDGGGVVRRYAPDMHASALARLELKADLEHALDAGQLVVHYQPVVDLVSLRITGVEALVRWQHPDRGLVPPSDFIPLAEETGLIHRLGQWVLDQACAQAARWRQAVPGAGRLTVSVNLSPLQLSDPDLAAQVRGVLGANRLAPEALILEITEGALAGARVDVVTGLRQLKAEGVALALDDFGTGYSSLGYLDRYPLDIVKVDKSFVDRLDGRAAGPGGPRDGAGAPATPSTPASSAALFKAVLDIAAALSLEVVVEGIETARQLDALRELGCRLGQGYVLSRPMPADTVTRLLAAGRLEGALQATG